MATRSFKMLPALAALSVVVALACGNRAYADTLYVGSPPGPQFTITYNNSLFGGTGTTTETGSGGNFQNSTLNGAALPWVYCTDIRNDITVPGTYDSTTVSTNGSQTGQPGGTVHNSDQVAWLLLNNANAALTNTTLEANLQAAIWYEEYGTSNITLTFTVGSYAGAQALIAAIPGSVSGYTSQVLWLSPDSSGANGLPPGIYQGLVTAVPEPSSLAVAGLGGLAMLMFLRRRKIA
jgi:hypothetical protein